MNRVRAMKRVNELLHNDFGYIYKIERTKINELHLTYKMDSKTHGLQTSMMFEEAWVDILTFISPTAVDVNSSEYLEVMKTINFINWSSKSACGRMYVDAYGDIVYSLRFTYLWIDNYPDVFINEYESAIKYYEDLFVVLLDVAFGHKSSKEAMEFITVMWELE